MPMIGNTQVPLYRPQLVSFYFVQSNQNMFPIYTISAAQKGPNNYRLTICQRKCRLQTMNA